MIEAQFPEIHKKATIAAHEAANRYFKEKLGGVDQYSCGFAWVDVYKVRSNSKLGKALLAAGFRKSYTRSLQLWNPSKFYVQNVDTLEAGARAYADVLNKYGIEASVGSRLD